MQLSKRLQAVVGLVTPGGRVADVGCDHAYIPIYLAENKISRHIIAMDMNQGPICRAQENIMKYGFEDRIETRQSDGLKKLRPGEADTILIAGMGGALTIQILTDCEDTMKAARELVLQPQSEIHKVRQMLSDREFLIIEENMVQEDGKYYVMMKAVQSFGRKDIEACLLTRKEHFYYGKLLLENRHPVLKDYLLWDLSLCEGILKVLEKENTQNSRLRQEEMKQKLNLIHLGLEYYGDSSTHADGTAGNTLR